MTTLTSTFSKFASYLKLAGFGAAVLLAACDDGSSPDDSGDLEEFELSDADAEFDGFELVAVDAEPPAELGVVEVGDVWVDDCNTCMLTADGPACTRQACVDPDVSAPYDIQATCEDGEYVEGEMWISSCNVCTCTFQGTACTKKECPPDSLPY